MALKRVGLDETNTTFVNQMRLYLNMAAKELGALADWWWLYKQGTVTTTRTVTVSGVSGTFQVGETIRDNASTPRTGIIAASYSAANAPTLIYYHTPSTTVDYAGTLTGATSGATATIVTDLSTRQYQLASDVLQPYSWRDETNNRPLTIASWDEMDQVDADQNENGDVRWIVPEGIDSNTGYHVVAVFPRHATTNETLRYRYYGYVPDWTSSNDNTSLDGWLPQLLQPALIYEAAALYQLEKGDEDGAEKNRQQYDRLVDRALRVNGKMYGNRHRARSNAGVPDGFRFLVQEGSLTA